MINKAAIHNLAAKGAPAETLAQSGPAGRISA